MQRYTGTGGGSGVGSNGIGGASSRDNTRIESSYSASSFSNSRRQSQLAPYKLKCDRESLNGRLGPPDFYPQTTNCPEETLTREYLQSGYKETVEGIEEAREIALSQGFSFSKPESILKLKEQLRKRLRAINESRSQKRKAGQVYGVPLSGQLLTKSGVFPEQKPCNEDGRRKWIEALSQPHKQLHSLSDHVPHGYRRKALFEVLIRHNVPFLRASWFIKVNYLNQVRPSSINVSSAALDKAHIARSDLWSKDVVEYMLQLLDEFFPKDGSNVPFPNKNQSSQNYIGVHYETSQKVDSCSTPDADEPSLHFKWQYMCRLVLWHLAEGLMHPAPIIEFILNQLQEKESLEAFELLLPFIFDVIDSVALSQTYVRTVVDLLAQKIHDLSSNFSSSINTSEKLSFIDSIVEIVRYLMVSVPDTFVALDCFPLPACVVPDLHCKNAYLKSPDSLYNKQFDTRDAYLRYLSCGYIISSVHKRASNLSKIVNPSLQAHGAAKVLQVLDRALITGNIMIAYTSLFEDLLDTVVEERWIAEISPPLRSSLKWIGTITWSFICSVFFLCEWATCNYRDCRTSMPRHVKFSGRKDFSQIYFAVSILKLKMEDLLNSNQCRERKFSVGLCGKNSSEQDTLLGGTVVENVCVARNNSKALPDRKNKKGIFESPGPLHDILVCWLDQHEIGKAGSFKDVELFLLELIRNGIFYPHAYVRQLIVSGIMDKDDNLLDLERQQRHRRILQQLPGYCLFNILEEARIVNIPFLSEISHAYSNERRLVLQGRLCSKSNELTIRDDVGSTFSLQNDTDYSTGAPESHHAKIDRVTQLKILISNFLRFPLPFTMPMVSPDESNGISKRISGSLESKVDTAEEKIGCDECRKEKRQKLTDDRTSILQGFSSHHSDDEGNWWVKKGPKSQESFKVEHPPKLIKNTSRGRQKIVRKTQSLAQLASTRIESSQGASTSHVCDNKIGCPHHHSGPDAEAPKDASRIISGIQSDICKALKQLRLLERRSISIWLLKSIRQLIEENEKAPSKVSNCSDVFSVSPDDRGSSRWKLGEDEFLFIIYIFDISCDLVSAVRFLILLLPKVISRSSTVMHGARNSMLPKNREGQVCQIGETILFSSLQRYESVLRTADLLPDVLTALIRRPYGSISLAYARNLLKKYRDATTVSKWEKSLRSTYDQRLLAELDNERPLDGEFMFSSGISAGVTDSDDEHIRLKMNARMSRIGPNMKELIQHVDEAVYNYGKDRKYSAVANSRNHPTEKWNDSYKIAHDIVLNLVDFIRQNSGITPEVDPSLVASAVSAIIASVGTAISKIPDLMASSNQLNCARYILQIHITSLCLLKEALGDRLGRMFELALAAEASSSISANFATGKPHRNQFQLSPDANEIYPNNVGRPTKAAAVSALVIGLIVHGVVSLERMITAFRLKEGLDVLQFIRSSRSSSNGISRSIGMMKLDFSIEVYVHWFRLLVGNCKTVFDGLIAEMVGESYVLALSRMQHLLPLGLVFPPSYSIFAMVIWRSYIFNNNVASREDNQLYLCFSTAIIDAVRHKPFRDLFFRNTQGFYDLLSNDTGDSEFAAMLELHSPDKHLKTMAFIPLRARLFLNTLIDCKIPALTIVSEDGSWVSGPAEHRSYADTESKILDQLMHVLDTLQPAKFHWQWVELRLLLNEQSLIEKIETHNMSFVEAIRSLSPSADNFVLSESEKKFTEIILTRILVRPEAAPLYSEVVNLLGKLIQESLVMDTKWILAGPDVLLGRKSIKQQLIHVALRRSFSTKARFWKPWGWSNSLFDTISRRGDKGKFEDISVEEGEVVDDSTDVKKASKVIHNVDSEIFNSGKQYIIEKALAELILPCIDRSASELRNLFANELIKQMGAIDQQINTITSIGYKSSVNHETSSSKGNTRKSIRGGSPVLSRRPTDSAPPSMVALKISLCLRLQFLLRLLPIIYEDRNMRQILAPIILRLLGTRLVYEDADLCLLTIPYGSSKRELESASEFSFLDHASDSLFDILLAILHGLLSSFKPSWLKPKSASKSSVKPTRNVSPFDREAAENLQTMMLMLKKTHFEIESHMHFHQPQMHVLYHSNANLH
ncbi:mediator of RNA polymerase II transcription subunit 12 isoform X2 [Zingiber officinale]|uniref:mediator of RNA polymerase II transcription subunit 12 isoform X2 n=1 Tax=Zingiber officinale TaxID=94328 RepID=UPI001C4C3B03|nr:mediator of RNA polymerase II transcription subunit 12 isoform X2 [Zingiber officinale]